MIGANELADEFNRPPPQISQPLGRSRPTLCCDLVESIQEKMSVARTPCSHQVVGSWKTYTSGVSLKGFGRIGLRLMVSEIDVNGELRRSSGAVFAAPCRACITALPRRRAGADPPNTVVVLLTAEVRFSDFSPYPFSLV